MLLRTLDAVWEYARLVWAAVQPARVSLASTLAVGIALLLVPQGQDILVEIAERRPDWSWFGLFGGLLWLGLIGWAWARSAVTLVAPDPSTAEIRRLRRILPRIIGALPFYLVAIALLSAALGPLSPITADLAERIQAWGENWGRIGIPLFLGVLLLISFLRARLPGVGGKVTSRAWLFLGIGSGLAVLGVVVPYAPVWIVGTAILAVLLHFAIGAANAEIATINALALVGVAVACWSEERQALYVFSVTVILLGAFTLLWKALTTWWRSRFAVALAALTIAVALAALTIEAGPFLSTTWKLILLACLVVILGDALFIALSRRRRWQLSLVGDSPLAAAGTTAEPVQGKPDDSKEDKAVRRGPATSFRNSRIAEMFRENPEPRQDADKLGCFQKRVLAAHLVASAVLFIITWFWPVLPRLGGPFLAVCVGSSIWIAFGTSLTNMSHRWSFPVLTLTAVLTMFASQCGDSHVLRRLEGDPDVVAKKIKERPTAIELCRLWLDDNPKKEEGGVRPCFIVAAEGGGSRAAYWTSTVLGHLQASPEFGNHLLAISAVSGGAVGAATFRAPSLLGYWTFDEGTGQVVADLSPAGNHGFLGESLDPDSADPLWVEKR